MKLNQEAERAAFEAGYVKEAGLSRKFMLSQNSDGSYAYEETECMWEAWQGSAARRAPAVGKDGLPPLPVPEYPSMKVLEYGERSIQCGYTAEQYRQGQRDAIAADRRARDGAVINYGNPVDKSSVGPQDDLREELDELQNKYDMQNSQFWETSLKLQQAEEQIADLRAQLALKSQEGSCG